MGICSSLLGNSGSCHAGGTYLICKLNFSIVGQWNRFVIYSVFIRVSTYIHICTRVVVEFEDQDGGLESANIGLPLIFENISKNVSQRADQKNTRPTYLDGIRGVNDPAFCHGWLPRMNPL